MITIILDIFADQLPQNLDFYVIYFNPSASHITVLAECPIGIYGLNCLKKCGHCVNNSCDPGDGKCLGGCEGWYVGYLCMEEIGES